MSERPKEKILPNVIRVPDFYIINDYQHYPTPEKRTAYGKVKYVKNDVAIIKAEGTYPSFSDTDFFDNYCLCHTTWTMIDGRLVDSLNEKLLLGEGLVFVFKIWKVRERNRPLYCTVEKIMRDLPLIIVRSGRKRRNPFENIDQLNNLNTAGNQSEVQPAPSESDGLRFNIRTGANGSARNEGRIDDYQLPYCMSNLKVSDLIGRCEEQDAIRNKERLQFREISEASGPSNETYSGREENIKKVSFKITHQNERFTSSESSNGEYKYSELNQLNGDGASSQNQSAFLNTGARPKSHPSFKKKSKPHGNHRNTSENVATERDRNEKREGRSMFF